MFKYQYVIQEILRVEDVTLSVKQEIKTLKNRVRAYKGWTKRYRRQQQELKQANLTVSKERDEAVVEIQNLQIKQQQLLADFRKAAKAAEERDKALAQLDEVIKKIEQYREVCERAQKITYANKTYLIKEAENIFFDDPIINDDHGSDDFDCQSKPQMFTDRAAINRYLLDR
ncbi:MAG: hypothetical protein AAFQ14_16890 [Cyanobacteria bacterium J06621_12]